MIELNWTLFLQFANFLVLLLVLNFLLYRPLRRLLEQRRENIDGSLSRAKELETRIGEKMSRYQERLQTAKLKGNQEKLALRQQALEEEGRTLGQAREQAAGFIQNIKNQVAEETELARRALSSETKALAGQIAAKVLGRTV
ncbi:MAG: hypothetical protein IH614_16460 [Desulfuromonadales bacterium]|nr:hypothetical protein [Desulfuromonadales bacterium]